MEDKERFMQKLKDGVVAKPYIRKMPKILENMSLKKIAQKSAINGKKFPDKIKAEKPTRYIKYVKE